MNEYELYHHGVKGQKWGVRRTAAQLGHRVAGAASKTGKVLYKGASKAGKATGRAVGKGAKKAEKAAIATAKKKYAEGKEKRYYKKLHKKKLSQMTDKEIADLTKRVKQEAALKDIKYESRVQNARKFYKNVAQKPLETVATIYAKEAAKKMFSDDDDNGGNSNNNSNTTKKEKSQAKTSKSKTNNSDISFDVEVNDAPSRNKTTLKQPSSLERTLARQKRAEGEMKINEVTKPFNNVKNTPQSDRYFEELSKTMGNNTTKRQAADFTEKHKMMPSNNSTKAFDDYFESEVRKEEERRRRR